MLKKKIILTGGTGRFGRILKRNYNKSKFNILFPSSKTLDILNPLI